MRKYLLILFISTFLIFNLNLNSVGSGDTIPAKLLPFNILEGKGLYFDNYVSFLQIEKGTTYFFLKSDNHYVSSYPILTGLIALPFYIPAYLYLKANSLTSIGTFYQYSLVLQKLAASFLASLSVVLFFLLVKNISLNNRISLFFSLIFAFATQTFSVSSQGLWQHGTANLFIIISQLFLFKALNTVSDQRKNFYIFSFIGAAASFWSRLNSLLYFVLLITFILFKEKGGRLTYLLMGILGLLSLISFNMIIYNSPLGGYGSQTATLALTNFFSGLSGLMLSPSRGTVFYTPIFIFGILSILFFKKIAQRKETVKLIFYLNFLHLISGILLNVFWGCWWGGHSFGNRLLTDVAVPAVICAYFFYILNTGKLIRIIFYLVIVYSIFIQLIGVLNYTHSYWDSKPTNIDFDTKRLWDFKDNPIFRSLRVGPDSRGLEIIQNLIFRKI
ncbi:MAG: hypothetical protein V1808_01750 [Candidatus Daviesbacteria bacterium]